MNGLIGHTAAWGCGGEAVPGSAVLSSGEHVILLMVLSGAGLMVNTLCLSSMSMWTYGLNTDRHSNCLTLYLFPFHSLFSVFHVLHFLALNSV